MSVSGRVYKNCPVTRLKWEHKRLLGSCSPLLSYLSRLAGCSFSSNSCFWWGLSISTLSMRRSVHRFLNCMAAACIPFYIASVDTISCPRHLGYFFQCHPVECEASRVDTFVTATFIGPVIYKGSAFERCLFFFLSIQLCLLELILLFQEISSGRCF